MIKLKNVAYNFGCGDSSCVWGTSGGQHTNSGCDCFVKLSINERIKIRKGILMLRKTLEEAENEISFLKNKISKDG